MGFNIQVKSKFLKREAFKIVSNAFMRSKLQQIILSQYKSDKYNREFAESPYLITMYKTRKDINYFLFNRNHS